MASLSARLAVFLQAGLSPQRCWEELATDNAMGSTARDFAERVCDQLREGGRHAASIHEVCRDGPEPERVFSALITVADESGTPLSDALWALADALRDRVSIEAEIRAITQAPRQTTWLLLAMPPLGILVAGMLGVDALGFLTGSGFGWLLLIASAVLYSLAMFWMRRLVRQLTPETGYLSPAKDLLAVATQGGALPEVARARVDQALIDHGLSSGPSDELASLTDLSRRAGIPISTLAVVEAKWNRHRVRAEAAEAAQALSVRVLIPLGLLILPAFVMVGVVPVVFTLLMGALDGGAGDIW